MRSVPTGSAVVFFVGKFVKIYRNHLEFTFQMEFEEMQKSTYCLTCQKLPQTRALKKHYKTLIILLAGPKYMKNIVFSQLDLKCILKKQKSEKQAHFCMVKLLLARGISRIPMIFFPGNWALACSI